MAESHPFARFRASQEPPWSQEKLGNEIGVEGITVYRWEAGLALPQRRYWPKIVQITGIPINEILLAGAAA